MKQNSVFWIAVNFGDLLYQDIYPNSVQIPLLCFKLVPPPPQTGINFYGLPTSIFLYNFWIFKFSFLFPYFNCFLGFSESNLSSSRVSTS